jgi:hypothetical protein
MPEGAVNHQAPRSMIEALGATRLNVIFLVETAYPGYPQSDTDEIGPPKRADVYLVLPDPNVGCQPAAVPFWLGAAAIVLIFSFFGFFASRLPFCSRLAMTFSLVR